MSGVALLVSSVFMLIVGGVFLFGIKRFEPKKK
jgi:hypothetical protein